MLLTTLDLLRYADADLDRDLACAPRFNPAMRADRAFAASDAGMAPWCASQRSARNGTGREAPCG